MQRYDMSLKFAAAVSWAICVCIDCGISQAAEWPPGGGTPFCGPCVPERVSYGYFPTIWRRWPTEHLRPATSQPSETTPTPATQEAPGQPADIPLAPEQPETTPPATMPEEPPFGEPPPAMPDQGPIELPFGQEPPPFDDAPPALPTEPKDSGLPSFDPTAPPAPPSGGFPEPGTSVVPDQGEPPVMPDDDPFRDDPNQEPPGTTTPKPSSSTHDALDRIREQAAGRWHGPEEVPGQASEMAARPLRKHDEPRHLEKTAERAVAPLSPRQRENPIRSAKRSARPRETAPTASLTSAETPAATSQGVKWRHNPLRSN